MMKVLGSKKIIVGSWMKLHYVDELFKVFKKIHLLSDRFGAGVTTSSTIFVLVMLFLCLDFDITKFTTA